MIDYYRLLSIFIDYYRFFIDYYRFLSIIDLLIFQNESKQKIVIALKR